MFKRIAILSSLWVAVPGVTWAAWDLFGAGKIAESVADIAKTGATAGVQILLIKTIEHALPQLMGFIVLIVCIVGALVALALAAKLADDFKDVIATELKTAAGWFAKTTVIFYGLIVTPTILAMLAFGLFLAYASYSGISSFIK